jgi:hypothetical protein
MVSVNDFKKQVVVKGTTGKFKGVLLKHGKNPKVEIWNGYKVNTVEAADVEYIQCEFSKKKKLMLQGCSRYPRKHMKL